MAREFALVVDLQSPDANVAHAGNGNTFAVKAATKYLVDVVACPCRKTAFDDCGDFGGGIWIAFYVVQVILPNTRINAFRPARDQSGVSPMVILAVQAYIGLAGGGLPV